MGATLASLALLPSLGAPLSADDQVWLSDVPARPGLAALDPWLRTDNPFRNTYYLPLQSLAFALVEALGSASALRVVLIGAHLAAGLALYRLLRDLSPEGAAGQRPAALAAVALWLHPVNLRAVSWLSAALSHVLPTALILASCVAWTRYCRRPGGGAWSAAIACVVLAAGLRETAVFVPLLWGAITWAVCPPARRRWVAAAGIPALMVSLAVVWVQWRLYPQGQWASEWGGWSAWRLAPGASEILGQALYPFAHPAALMWVAQALVCATLLAGWLRARANPRPACLAVAAVLFTLPFAGLDNPPPPVAGRYFYLPSGALWGSMALALGPVAAPWRKRLEHIAGVAMGVAGMGSAAWFWTRGWL